MENKIKAVVLWLAFCLMAGAVHAQGGGGVIVTGKVYADDEPDGFIGATVIEQDRNGRIYSSALTDFNGNFALKVKDPSHTLNFSFVGYVRKTLPIGARRKFDVKLELQNVMKEVELTVDVIPGGGAAEGDSNVTVDIEPKTITISGEAADLAELDSISLGEIDLSQVFGTETRRMTIPLDASLTNVSGPAEATVTVQVEGLSTKTLEVTNINTSNEPDGYHVDVVTQSLTVMVRGTQEAVDAVVASQIRVVADLSDLDLSTGTRTVPVRVYLDGSSEVGVMGEYNISISISRP